MLRQVQEIISVVYELSCVGIGFSLCLFTGISMLGVYFFAPSPFSGAGAVFHEPPPLLPTIISVYDSTLFFNFVGSLALGAAHWLRR
jgi:hypothetical protein